MSTKDSTTWDIGSPDRMVVAAARVVSMREGDDGRTIIEVRVDGLPNTILWATPRETASRFHVGGSAMLILASPVPTSEIT